jgi:hypothetical protein
MCSPPEFRLRHELQSKLGDGNLTPSSNAARITIDKSSSHHLSHSETNRANCWRSPVRKAKVTDWNVSVPLTIESRASHVRGDKVWGWTKSKKG